MAIFDRTTSGGRTWLLSWLCAVAVVMAGIGCGNEQQNQPKPASPKIQLPPRPDAGTNPG